jgi:hypothetical protein
MSTFEKIKVFIGRCFKPRFENIIAEISLNIEDIDKLRDWALANDGRITLQVSRAKSGKEYSEINTYKKNPPNGSCGEYAQSNEFPIQQPAQYPRESQQESRYSRDDRPAPMPEPPPMPESSQEEDDDIPF